MMKEAKPMLQNLNSSTPTSHKSQLLPDATTAPLQQQSRKTKVTVSDDELPPYGGSKVEESGRERLKRHRVEVAGQVWIPDIWGQENFLHDWIDCSAFDSPLLPNQIMSARASLVEEGRRALSGILGCGFIMVLPRFVYFLLKNPLVKNVHVKKQTKKDTEKSCESCISF